MSEQENNLGQEQQANAEGQQAAETEAAKAIIVANHDPLVDVKEATFTFRKAKDDSGVETKRANIVAKVAVPSVEGLIAILQAGGKPLDLLLAAAESVVMDYAKQVLADDPSIVSDTFPSHLISFDIVANLPDTERRGRGIPKEMWEDFLAAYVEHMPSIIGKNVEIVKKQAAILAQKFSPLRNHEKKNDLLPKFVEMLSLFVNGAPDAEQFSAPVEFLINKADAMMKQDNSTDLEANLGF